MIGRTLGQYAVPTTFATVDGPVVRRPGRGGRSPSSRTGAPAGRLGGPTGDGSSYGERGADIAARFAHRLGSHGRAGRRGTPSAAPIAGVAGAWGAGRGGRAPRSPSTSCCSPRSDVGELAERADGAGGSSSMPHKHNPIAAISARAAAMQVPGLVATLLHAAGSHELERAAGAWHAEWPALNAAAAGDRLGGRLAVGEHSSASPSTRPGWPPTSARSAGGDAMTEDRYEAGMRVRREVLGDEHVDRATAAADRHRRRLPALHHRERVGVGCGPATTSSTGGPARA